MIYLGARSRKSHRGAHLEDVANDNDYHDGNVNTQLAVGFDPLVQAVLDVIITDCPVLRVCNGFVDVASNRCAIVHVGRDIVVSTRVQSEKFADSLGRVRIIDVVTAFWAGIDTLVTQ